MRLQPWLFLAFVPLSLQAADPVGCGIVTNLLVDVDFALSSVIFAAQWLLSGLGIPGRLFPTNGPRGTVVQLPSQAPYSAIGHTITQACSGAFYFAVDVLPNLINVDAGVELRLVRNTLTGPVPLISLPLGSMQGYQTSDGWTHYQTLLPTLDLTVAVDLQILLLQVTAGAYVLLDNPYFGLNPPPSPPSSTATSASIASSCTPSANFTTVLYQSNMPTTTSCSIPPWVYDYYSQ